MPTVCWTEVTHVDETQYWGEKNHEKQSHLTLPQNRTKAKERPYSYSEDIQLFRKQRRTGVS